MKKIDPDKKLNEIVPPGEMCLYVICKEGESVKSKSCYIGVTTTFRKRMRQHNGEIKGGAKRTRYYHGKVEILAVVTGPFLSWRDLLRCEFCFHRKTKRKSVQQKLFFLTNNLFHPLRKWTFRAVPVKDDKRNNKSFFIRDGFSNKFKKEEQYEMTHKFLD